jgi:hypothetical protein
MSILETIESNSTRNLTLPVASQLATWEER